MNKRLTSDYHNARDILRLCLLPVPVAVEGKLELCCAVAEAPAFDPLLERHGSVFWCWDPLHSQYVLSRCPEVYGSERNKPNGCKLLGLGPERPKYKCAHLYSRVCTERTSSRSCSLQWYNYINNATFLRSSGMNLWSPPHPTLNLEDSATPLGRPKKIKRNWNWMGYINFWSVLMILNLYD